MAFCLQARSDPSMQAGWGAAIRCGFVDGADVVDSREASLMDKQNIKMLWFLWSWVVEKGQ